MILTGTSADKCGKVQLTDRSFKDRNDFENYVRGMKPFSENTNPPISQCLSQSFPVQGSLFGERQTLPEQKHRQFIADYYLTSHRLKSGISQSLQDITAIDHLIRSPLLNGISCNGFKSIDSVYDECLSLKKCSSAKKGTEALKKSASDTLLAVKAIETIEQTLQ